MINSSKLGSGLLGLFAIRDNVVGMWNPPFFAPSDSAAVLSVRQSLLDDVDKKRYLNRAKSLSLYSLGAMNMTTGEIDGVLPALICDLDQIFDVSELGDEKEGEV